MPASNAALASTPYWQSECGRTVVYVGDCRKVLEQVGPDKFHAVVTDPPYGLEFMGKDWDAPWKNDGKTEVCTEITNTSHPFRDGTQRVRYGNKRRHKVDAKQRRANEMDDPVKSKYLRHNVEYVCDSHLYHQWFHTCAEAMLRVARPGAHLLSFGGTRMWHRTACALEDAGWDIRDTIMWLYGSGFPKSHDVSKSIDKALGAEREVTGTAPPLWEDWEENYGVNSRPRSGLRRDNPVTDTARQWHGWGTALKPACEPIILARKAPVGSVAQNTLSQGCGGLNIDGCRVGDRWPSNVIHDGSDEVVLSLPNGTSRYFYSAKADESDRPQSRDTTAHPTVKPLDLMRYLVRLVCAPGGTVLDPFMGSGSTGCAAILEGMRFVGIEQSREYADLAVGRLKLSLSSKAVQDTPAPPGKSLARGYQGTSLPPERLRGV